MKLSLDQDGIHYEFDAASPSQIFDKLAIIEQVKVESCGECGSDNIARQKFMSKKGNEMRKLRCLDCSAQLDVVVSNKDGSLFYGRKDADGRVKGTRATGWEVYVPQNNQGGGNYGGSNQSEYSEPASNAPPPAAAASDDSIPF